MNTHMLENPITQDNIRTLAHYGFTVIPSGSGLLACGDVGSGRLPDEDVLLDYVDRALLGPKDLAGRKIVVTAGATREPLDPVRYLTNHSTGKMGYAVARGLHAARGGRHAAHRADRAAPGAVCQDCARSQRRPTCLRRLRKTSKEPTRSSWPPPWPTTALPRWADNKIKKKDGDLSLPLARTDDILGWLGEHKPAGLFVCGFSMETENLLENSAAKLKKKNLDLIVANNLKTPGAGFGTDTNVVTMISAAGAEELPLMDKTEVGDRIADKIAAHFAGVKTEDSAKAGPCRQAGPAFGNLSHTFNSLSHNFHKSRL